VTVQSSMPALYVPHGGGPAFFMDGAMGDLFRPMAEFLATVDTLLPTTPTALLVVTAHWEAPVTTVTGGAHPDLVYDYFGFPPETYRLTYSAPGAPDVAAAAADLLRRSDIDVAIDPAHGWDHGVFIPLKVMYPEAGIPVVAMSLKAGLDADEHADIGAALRPLRDEGVLIVGSGMSYHNLGVVDGTEASTEFHRWLDTALAGDATRRRSHLAAWASAPSGRASHPREEHLLPLMVASGAGGDLMATKIWAGSMGRTPVAAWSFD
jgi:aromatic ring-opening dioxygenase catalytic subunit (LigB family)